MRGGVIKPAPSRDVVAAEEEEEADRKEDWRKRSNIGGIGIMATETPEGDGLPMLMKNEN